MRKALCVPMIALCLLLTGCSTEQKEQVNPQSVYQEMSACEMTAVVTCGQENLEWTATLQCHYEPEGVCTVEVLDPAELAGVRAVIRPEDWSLEYGDLCLNIGTLSQEEISPATCLVRLIDALRNGWLLEENKEDWNGEPCCRLRLGQTGAQEELTFTVWLRQSDGLPVRGEIAVEDENILTAEFTHFDFCATITENTEDGI